MTEVLLHYTDDSGMKPLASVAQYPDTTGIGKPQGLWFSVEGEYDWKWWCEAEKFRLDRLKRAYEIRLTKDARMLRISTAEGIDAVNETYGYRPYSDRGLKMMMIKWHQIARDYQGIIIAPYIWERRFGADCLWYYGWDCASGCIWDVTAIAGVDIRA